MSPRAVLQLQQRIPLSLPVLWSWSPAALVYLEELSVHPQMAHFPSCKHH